MRTRIVLLSLILATCLASEAGAQLPDRGFPPGFPQRFEIDPAHSEIAFRVPFMGLSSVRGAFAAFGGDILYLAEEPARWSVSAKILTRSISTNSPTRDRHLRSPDFLGVEEYPYITFRSTAIRPVAAGFVAEGDLTLHGITKHIALPFVVRNPPVADAWGNARMTLEAQYHVSRKEFDIRGTAFWNSEFDPGRTAVGDQVDIELLISAVIPNVQTWTDKFGDSLLTEIRRRGVRAAMADLRAASAGDARFDSLPDFPFIVAGEKLRASGQARDGAALYEGLTAWRPRSQSFALKAGEAYLTLGDTSRARTLFEGVLRIDSLATTAQEWLRFLSSRR